VVNTEQYPSWSPNGKEIAFTDTLGCEECSEIDIATENGESSFQLTTSGVNGDPSWSPTGALIAYAHSSSVTATTGYIYVVSPEGNGPRPLVGSLPGGGIVDGPAVWSPNGSELALTALGGGSNGTTGQGIYLIGADGKGLHRLTTGNDQGPVWSPNGKVIAFSRVTPLPLKTSRSDVYLIGSNGQGLHRLVSGAMQSNSPSWSPSGSQIAFAGSPPKEGWTALYVTGATGGVLRRLTPYQVVINPSWSPNGAVIAFTSPHGGPLSLSNNWDVDVVPSNGGAERDLSGTDYAFSDTYLVWQP
jgi:Tol biopolymer transport system component